MRKNIAQIVSLAMEARQEDQKTSKLLKKITRNKLRVSQEGFFDIFKGKSKEAPKKELTLDEHLEELQNAQSVSIRLQTDSVDNEIAYYKEMISKGLPFFKADIKRLEDCFHFIINNKTTILDKIDKLVDISYPKYKLSKEGHADFNTFQVQIFSLSKSKELQKDLSSWDRTLFHEDDFWEEIDTNMTREDKNKYTSLYNLDAAIPRLDLPFPKHKRSGDQENTVLQKDDPKLEQLLQLYTELIEKSPHILDRERWQKLWKLASDADESVQPELYGDGDEYGVIRIIIHDSGYMYMLTEGFKQNFMNHYHPH